MEQTRQTASPARPAAPRVLPLIAGIAAASLACSSMSPSPHDVREQTASLLARGDSSGAIALLESRRIDTPDQLDLALLLGELQRSRGTILSRLQSQRTLERARQLHPEDPRVLLALGQTYYAQQFFPDAVRCFRAALTRDSSLCEARYALACYHFDKWLRVNAYTDDLELSVDYLHEVIRCDSTRLDPWRRLIRAQYVLERNEACRNTCRLVAKRFPQASEPLLCLGAIAWDNGEYDVASSYFDDGLRLLAAPEHLAYFDFTRIVSLDHIDDFDELRFSEKERYERGFWVRSDPDPTTPGNERFIEHVYRVYLSDVYYGIPRVGARGWDTERGETFIKFGHPDHIVRSMGEVPTDGRDEVWIYILGEDLLRFYFVDKLLNGNMRVPRSQGFRLAFVRHNDRVSAWESEQITLPGDVDVMAFRDDDFSSTVYTALRIAADTLTGALDISSFDHFVFRTAYYDEGWRADTLLADTLWTSEIRRAYEAGRPVFDLVRSFTRPFSKYHVCCAFEDENATARFLARRDIDTEHFTGGRLSLSDILLYDDTTAGGIERNGMRFSPRTGRRYRKRDPLRVYVEVYDLARTGPTAAYRVTWSIYAAGPEKTPRWKKWGAGVAGLVGLGPRRDAAISQTFDREASGHTSFETMSIDISRLPEGLYDLEVSVVDEQTGGSARRRAQFFRVPARRARAGSTHSAP